MANKIMSMSEAIGRFVKDGMSVVMGTALESLIPFAAGHEIIRQEKRELTLVGPISDMLFDQIIGAGCARRARVAWIGNVSMGSSYNFRRAVEEEIPRPLEVEDHSNLTICMALHAAALGVPFLPTRTALGSGIMASNKNIETMIAPFTGEKMAAVRAIAPDVAILPVQRCDPEGNAHLWGNTGVSVDAANASRCVILVTEEIVSPDIIRSDPNRTMIPGFLVAAAVCESFGSHPSPVQGYWGRDHQAYVEYHGETRTRSGFEAWLETWVLGVNNRREYREKLGAERVEKLRVRQDAFSVPVNFGY